MLELLIRFEYKRPEHRTQHGIYVALEKLDKVAEKCYKSYSPLINSLAKRDLSIQLG